jgi:hypothetical protein
MEAMEAMARRAGYGRGWKIIHHLHGPPHHDIAGLEPLHEQVIQLLGPYCAKIDELSM